MAAENYEEGIVESEGESERLVLYVYIGAKQLFVHLFCGFEKSKMFVAAILRHAQVELHHLAASFVDLILSLCTL